MASPVAHDVSATQFEDGFVFITLTATDSDEGSGAAPSFSLATLPAHGTLWVVPPIPGIDPGLMAATGTAYAPDFVDAGSWGTTFYFIPDADWSGDTAFQYTATDSSGETSAPATASITLEAVADAPVVDSNAHDQPDALGPAFPVTTTSGTGSSAAEDGPQLAALDGGGFVMVWQVGLTTGQILARRFHADGTPDGDAFAVSVSGSPSEIRPAVAALDGGGFVAAWMQAGTDTGGFDIRAAIFGPGQTTATTLTVTATAAAREVLPTVTAIAGGFVVTWAVESGSTTTIRGQRYDAAGAAIGSEIELTTSAAHGPGSGSFFMPPEHVVTGLSGGGFVVSWPADDGTHARVVHADGSLGADITLAGAEAITAFGDGFIVTWADDELRARIYDADGQPTGPAFALTGDTTSGEHAPVIAVLPDGRFVVAWRGDGAGFGTDIFAAVYLADGTPNGGGPIQVTDTGSAPGGSGQIIFEAQPTITVLDDGRFAVGWIQPFASGGMQPDVFVRVYDPGVRIVSGPDGDPLPLPTTFALADQDGSEVLAQVRIEGLPEGFRIGDGTTVIGGREGGDPDGAWIIGASDAVFLAQLLAGAAQLVLLPTPDYVGDFALAITATSRETQPPIGSEQATSVAVTVPVSIFAANDAPVAVDDAPNTAATPIVADRNARTVEYVGPASVLANDSDPDAGETAELRVAFAGAGAATQVAVGPSGETAVLGTYGTLYIGADGSYRYVLDNRLTGTAALDAGEQATEQFVYTAANNGGGADNSDSATLSIVVEGVNDSPSQITLPTPTIDENAPNGTVVGTLTAYEPEGDPITWSMPNSAGGRFAIDPNTGVITVANAALLNYETNQTHTIGINATDGKGGFANLTEIVITLNDLNEAPHTLTLTIAAGRQVGTNHASITEDADTTNPVELGIYAYFDDALGAETVTLSGPDAAFFQLTGNTIFLRAGVVLDHEAKSSYSVTINVDDPTVGATADTAATLTLSVNDVDEPSTVASTTVTIDEDATYSLTLADFPFNDPEGERSIQYVQFQQPTDGSFWFDPTGGDHSDAFKLTGQFNLARVDIASGGLFFRPDANENGTPYASFSYRAFDGEEFTESATVTFNVTAVNDAPQWSNARSGDYAEGETILFSRDIAISDAELDARNGGLGDYGPGSIVRLRRSTGPADEDVFGFDTTGASFILTGNSLQTLDGHSFGSFSSFHGTLTITFSNGGAVPTRALVHDVLRHITYTNTRDDLPDDEAEFRWEFFDSNLGDQGTGGELSATALTELNFRPVNDGPENAVPDAQSVGEDTDLVFRSADGNAIRVSDPDSGDRDIVVELRVGHGTLTLGQTTGLQPVGNGTAEIEMRGTLAEINAALEGLIYRPAADYVGGDTLFVRTDDFGNSGSGDPEQDEDSVAITVERVNDAPQAADVAASGAEDTAIAVMLSGTDDNGIASFRIATLPANGALFLDAVGTIPVDPDQIVAGNGIAVVYFVPAANFNGDTGFQYFAIDDEGLDGNVAAVSIAVTAINDAPALAGDREITVAEGGTVALTTDDLTAVDPDDADASLVYTVTGVSHGTALLNGAATSSFTQADLAAGDVSFAHDGSEEAGSITQSLTDGAAAPQIVTVAVAVDPHGNDAPVAQDGSASGDEDTVISGVAAATDADDATAALSYSLAGANGGALHGSVSMTADGTFRYTPFADFNGIDTFAFSVTDAAGAASNIGTITVTIDPVKDSPEGNVPGNATPYVENQAPLAVDPALTVSDPDSTDLVGATVAITGGFVSGEDVLVFADQNGIAGSYDGTTGVLTLSGTSSLANYQAALRSVAYSNTSDDPSAAARTVDFQVDDGGGLTSLGVAGMTVIPVNDAPVNAASAVPDVAVSTATAIAGLSVTDLDAGAGAMTTTLSVVHGTLTVASAGGAAVGGSGTGTVTLSGTLAQINATLAAAGNVIYRGAAGFFGADTLTVTTDDNGNSGTGGTLGDADQVAIDVNTGTPGNDTVTAPSGSAAFNALGGNDTVTFDFRLVDATVSYVGNTVVIDTATSHTVLSGVETYVFTDGTANNNDGNPLIDDLFYYATYHDVWNAHADADGHYNSTGWHEGRDPSAFFQTAVYLSANPDVTGVNPLDHWHTVGWTEGRVPSITFDPAQYLAANPDVAAAHADPLAHFLQFGAQEGRVPFAPSELVAANGFDYVYYLNNNPDVAAAGVDPFDHFMTVGWTEGRNPNALFDVDGYLANYADVAAAHVNPLAHYSAFGWHEGRDPSTGFDTASYLAAYADVQAAGVNPLAHFLSFGIHEGRSPFADGLWG